MVNATTGYGVGFQILETAAFDPLEVKMAVELLSLRRRNHEDGVLAIGCGANIGVHTIEWATAMTCWGSVLAIEAQERIYYALAYTRIGRDPKPSKGVGFIGDSKLLVRIICPRALMVVR
jgi:hypothetical protein